MKTLDNLIGKTILSAEIKSLDGEGYFEIKFTDNTYLIIDGDFEGFTKNPAKLKPPNIYFMYESGLKIYKIR